MERDSLIYKSRRRLQVIAHRIISDETLSKVYYRIVMGQKLSFDSPKTFNEKLQWLKLYYFPYNRIVINATDKYLAREYVKSKGLGHLLTELYGNWTDAKQIEWDLLPKQFALKCNHGCAYNLLCNDKESFDKKKASKTLNKWLKEDFGAYNIEIHYSQITPHRILCEEYLGEMITDYKFFCFNGDPKFLYVSEDLIHDRIAKIGFYNLDGTKIPIIKEGYADLGNISFPPFFNEMVENAKVLSKDFPFVRVDYFLANNRYYFAELTFTPGGCMNDFNPQHYDVEWGRALDITDVMRLSK